MQARVVPVVLLLAAALVLAGCVNTPKDVTSATTGSTSPTGTTPVLTSGGDGAVLKLLSPLSFTVSTTGAKWVEPKTTVAFTTAGGQAGWAYVWATGPLMGTPPASTATLDTGSKSPSDWIAPGASRSLTFTEPGVFEMHCHPHPYMRSNVTVLAGYVGPKEVTVQITDGSKPSESRYSPDNIVVGPGTKVTYTNVGQQPHTATLLKASPALKKLDATASKADVQLDGTGWQVVRVLALDAEGRVGAAETQVYVAPLPKFTSEPKALDFAAGGVPEQAGAVGPFSFSFVLEYNAILSVNWSVQDGPAAGGAPVNNALVEVHVAKAGESQDVLTSEPKAAGLLTGPVASGTYNVKVVPKQGVKITGTIQVSADYLDVTPPDPSAAGEGGGDGHAGH